MLQSYPSRGFGGGCSITKPFGGMVMPDLKSDIIGRINRLPLRPTEKNSLTPLMEAISNSVFAITERFGEDAMKRGKIDIDIVRNTGADGEPIIGFDVTDNGIGFTDDNYESFLTPDSRHKEGKGGKGVGRLAWLKVFAHVDIDSVFMKGNAPFRRRFRFQLSKRNQIRNASLEGLRSARDRKTTASFRDFSALFVGRCPSKANTIALRILSHFVSLFMGGNAPKIIIHDGETIDIEALFADSIEDQRTKKLSLEIGSEQTDIEIWSVKCSKKIRLGAKGVNFGFIAGHSRSVVEYPLDEQLGLKLLDGESIYLGCASGEYLDRHVNAERTGFTLDSDEVDEIKRAIAREAKDFLSTYIQAALAEKVSTTREIIAENPQFLYVVQDVSAFAAEKLQPNAYRKEDIYVELARDRFRRNRQYKNIEDTITSSDVISETIQQKINDYSQYVSQEKRGALAEYVMRRKAVIGLLEKFLEYKEPETETYQREDAIHQLICPMRADSSTLTIDDHNLWLIDDRLAFFNYFASDKALSTYTGVDTLKRPDLAFFYDACMAWRQVT